MRFESASLQSGRIDAIERTQTVASIETVIALQLIIFTFLITVEIAVDSTALDKLQKWCTQIQSKAEFAIELQL